jgi:hypothetical protein
MASSAKVKGATKRAKKAAAQEKGRLEKAAHKVEAFAEDRGAEVRGRIAQARRHASRGKDKHPAA